MIANYATAITSSTAVTFALFYLMQMLIGIQPGVNVDSRVRNELRWVREEPLQEPPIIEARLMPRPTFTHPPPIRFTDSGDGEQGTIYVARTNPPPPGPANSTYSLPQSDGPLINIVRVQPVYPISAVQKGLEGFVIVRFDVLANGQTANATIIESSHRAFERSALKATSRLRYKPRIVAGVAVASTGIRYRFSFEMER